MLATGSSIASAGTSASEGCNAADSSMQSTSADGELQPLLDRQIGIGVAALAWRELLQCGGEHADRHVHRFEWLASVMSVSLLIQ